MICCASLEGEGSGGLGTHLLTVTPKPFYSWANMQLVSKTFLGTKSDTSHLGGTQYQLYGASLPLLSGPIF